MWVQTYFGFGDWSCNPTSPRCRYLSYQAGRRPIDDFNECFRLSKSPAVVGFVTVYHCAALVSARKAANGRMSPVTLAVSNAAMYALRWSSLMTVHGWPAAVIMTFIKKRAMRPFSSRNGWINTKMKCPRTTRTAIVWSRQRVISAVPDTVTGAGVCPQCPRRKREAGVWFVSNLAFQHGRIRWRSWWIFLF